MRYTSEGLPGARSLAPLVSTSGRSEGWSRSRLVVEMLMVARSLQVIHIERSVVIEHNLDVIAAADWIVDLGPEGGRDGGTIVAEGTQETIAARHPTSHTGRYPEGTLGRTLQSNHRRPPLGEVVHPGCPGAVTELRRSRRASDNGRYRSTSVGRGLGPSIEAGTGSLALPTSTLAVAGERPTRGGIPGSRCHVRWECPE